jgi:hypothetical protein
MITDFYDMMCSLVVHHYQFHRKVLFQSLGYKAKSKCGTDNMGKEAQGQGCGWTNSNRCSEDRSWPSFPVALFHAYMLKMGCPPRHCFNCVCHRITKQFQQGKDQLPNAQPISYATTHYQLRHKYRMLSQLQEYNELEMNNCDR